MAPALSRYLIAIGKRSFLRAPNMPPQSLLFNISVFYKLLPPVCQLNHIYIYNLMFLFYYMLYNILFLFYIIRELFTSTKTVHTECRS